MACQCAGRADRRSLPRPRASLHRARSKKWFTFTNGAHIDSLDPETLNRWYDFLELYVAHQAPAENAAVIRAAAPVIYQAAMGTPANDPITLPADPMQLQPTYDGALAAFEKCPARAGAVRQRRRDRADPEQPARRPLPRLRALLRHAAGARARRPSPGTSEPGARCTHTHRPRGTSTATPPTRAPWPAPTSPATPAPAGCGATRPSGAGTGSSGTPGPPSPTSPLPWTRGRHHGRCRRGAAVGAVLDA